MIFYLLLLIGAYLLSVLQATIINFNLILVLVMILGSRLTFPQSVFFAFVSGLFIDSATVRVLGQSSLGFIIILSILPLITYRFSFHNPISRFFLYFLLALIFEIYLGHGLLIWQSLLVSLLAIIFSKNEKEKIKL